MPDLTFFPDPNVDRVLGVVMELAAEVYTLRDRLAALEQMLAQHGIAVASELDTYQPTPELRARRLAERDAFIARLMAPMSYEPDSPAPAFEPA